LEKTIMAKRRGRPPGSGKKPGEKFILKTFKFPPALWNEFTSIVPVKQRSEAIREYMQKAIDTRKKLKRPG